MGGNTCLTRDLCDCYDDLREEFDNAGFWLGADDEPQITYQTIRAWWDRHGCVRCFIDAWVKFHWTNDWVQKCIKNGDQYHLGNPEIVPQMKKAIEKWKNPGSRKPGRYYCEDCVRPLRCGAMLHTSLAPQVGIGHTGWFYQVPDVWKKVWLYNYPPNEDNEGSDSGDWRVGEKVWGALDNIAGREVSVKDDSRPGFVTDIRNNGYVAYKEVWSRDGNFEEAFLTGLQWLNTPYMLVVNNCNQATHAVLTAFGADLIPSADDKNFGMYTPSQYFDFIRVPAVYFAPVSNSEATPSAPVRKANPKVLQKTLQKMVTRHRQAVRESHQEQASRCSDCKSQSASLIGISSVRGKREELGTDVVYLLEPGSALHLTLRCPALQSANLQPEEVGIPYAEDLRELEREFGGSVCGTCKRVLAAGERTKSVIGIRTGALEICGDRLRLNQSDGALEILYERITNQVNRWWSPAIAITYRTPLPNGVVASSTVDLTFETNDERDQCWALLQEAQG